VEYFIGHVPVPVMMPDQSMVAVQFCRCIL